MNLAAKLPPTPLLLPSAALLLASAVLVATLFVQGNALRDSASMAQPITVAGKDNDAPLSAAQPATPLTSLANSELFGHYDPAQAAATSPDKTPAAAPAALGDQAPDTLPDATLALKLQGIVFKKDPAQRRAIIAGDGPNAEARKIGETLLGDAVIRYIEARRVVVEQQGELKALRLPEAVLNNGAAPFAHAEAPPMPGSAPMPYVEQPMEQPYEPPPEDVDTGTTPEDAAAMDDSGNVEQSEPTE